MSRRSRPIQTRARRDHKAFSLAEMAIVLSVIGIISGSIWVAAHDTNKSNLVNQASTDMNVLLANIRAFYAGQNIAFVNLSSKNPIHLPPTAADFCTYTKEIMAANGFPSGMIQNGVANNPWSTAAGTACTPAVGSVLVSLACTTNGGSCGDPVQNITRFTGLPDIPTCENIILQNSAPEIGLNQILVNNTLAGAVGNTNYPLPVTPANAAKACSGAGPFTVDWYYNVGG